MANDAIPTYGGQAVIEGVMMRGAQAVAIAMRSPDDTIELHTEKLGRVYQSKAAKTPFLRGVVLLWDALVLGMRALTISANMQVDEDEELEGWGLYLTLAISLGIGVGLFFLIPATAGHFIGETLGIEAWAGNLIEGIIRLGILIGYIWGIGFMDDIQRVYGYHGAEHKTINAFEGGAELTPTEVGKYPLEHPRCGTAFLLTVVVFSIVFFTLLGPMALLPRLGVRLLLIPVLASFAYEFIRWTARHLDSPFVRWIIQPNLALQRLTTREPDEGMLEVAIAAFKEMKRMEELTETG